MRRTIAAILGVVGQNSETRENRVPVVLDVVGVSGGHEGQSHGAGVGHVGGGVEPVLKEEKHAEHEGRGLAFAEEIGCQQQRDQPLQNGSSPEAEGWAEPPEEQVAAFVDDKVGGVDEQVAAMHAECVDQEENVED